MVEEAAKLLVITALATNDLFLGHYLALMFSIKAIVALYKMSRTVCKLRRKATYWRIIESVGCCKGMYRSGREEQGICGEVTYQLIMEPFHLSITGSDTF